MTWSVNKMSGWQFTGRKRLKSHVRLRMVWISIWSISPSLIGVDREKNNNILPLSICSVHCLLWRLWIKKNFYSIRLSARSFAARQQFETHCEFHFDVSCLKDRLFQWFFFHTFPLSLFSYRCVGTKQNQIHVNLTNELMKNCQC